MNFVKLYDAKAAIAPTGVSPADLALINQYSLKPLAAPDVAVYTLQIANSNIDRDGERFSLEVLNDFAATLPGKGLLEAHQWGPVGVGLFFKSWLEQDGDTIWLMGSCYLPRNASDSADMIKKIDSGIAKWCSIGFFAPSRVPITAPGGKTFQEYRRGPEGKKAEALECSLVFLGAQYDAAVVKSLVKSLRAVAKSPGRFSFVLPRI